MKLDSTEIQHFLETAKQNPVNFGWAAHSRAVGDAAYAIANALKQNGVKIDPEKARILGYIHDIGKLDGNFDFLKHEVDGYLFLQQQGFPEDYCSICLTHSFVGNDPFCNISSQIPDTSHPEDSQSNITIDPTKEPGRFLINYIRKHDFNIYDKLINFCDALCTIKVTTLEKRIVDVISRHGVCSTTQKYINELIKTKTDFDTQLGYNLYDLFPEVKENL